MLKVLGLWIGYAALGFSFIGLLETLLGFWETKSYVFVKVLVYSLSFGLGMALVLR